MKRHATPSILSRLRRQVVIRRLGSYVRGEQSADARRETARLIDRDESAYAAYLDARETDRALSADLAPHGRPERAQLDRAFANIGAALNGRAPLYRLRHMPDWRASLVAVCLVALMLVPLVASANRAAATGIPTQPQPPTTVADTNITPTGDVTENMIDEPDLTTLTPQLATAKFITRATPTAPESE